MNPFILNQKQGNGPKTPHLAKVLTQKEQEEKLIGYLEINRENWPQTKYGTHIRYYTKNGDFRTGGFILKNPLEAVHPETKVVKTYFKIHNGFNHAAKGYYQWVVSYDELSRVYMKPDASVLMTVRSLESAVAGLNENIRKLVRHAKLLEERIEKLESKR